jgi:type II pantothenate kinase
MFQEA